MIIYLKSLIISDFSQKFWRRSTYVAFGPNLSPRGRKVSLSSVAHVLDYEPGCSN
jgi:hypothetical protein